MIGFVLKLAVALVVGVLLYNYFFGTPEEQAHSSKTFAQLKEIAVSVGELASSEKEKFDAGKYDAVLDKLGVAYTGLREGARTLDAGVLRQVDELEARRGELKRELDSLGREGVADDANQKRRREELHDDMRALVRDSDRLLQRIERR